MVHQLCHLVDLGSAAAAVQRKRHQTVVVGRVPEIGRLRAVSGMSVAMTADATRRELPIADELRHSRGHATGHHPLAGAGIIRAIVVVIRILVPKGLYQRCHPDCAITTGRVIVGGQCPPGCIHLLVGERGRRHCRTDFGSILGKPLLQLHWNMLCIEIALGGITQHRRDAVIGTDNHITVAYIIYV